jgi:hypothetical protein
VQDTLASDPDTCVFVLDEDTIDEGGDLQEVEDFRERVIEAASAYLLATGQGDKAPVGLPWARRMIREADTALRDMMDLSDPDEIVYRGSGGKVVGDHLNPTERSLRELGDEIARRIEVLLASRGLEGTDD